MNWYLEVLKKYAVFNGRARRKEFWMFALFNFIVALILSSIDYVLGATSIIYSIYILAIMIPSIAVLVRRLHDIGKSGWWYFIVFIPIVGAIWMVILLCKEGQSGENTYGVSPK